MQIYTMVRHVTPARITIFKVRNEGRHGAASLPSQYLTLKEGALHKFKVTLRLIETPCLKIQK